MTRKKFGLLLADPPWKFGDPLPGDGRGASKQYDCMTVEELCAFKIPRMADDAFLVLWRVSAMVEEAYQVGRAWGFTPKTEIVWQKLTKNGKPWFGMGRILRASHETAIIMVRGKPKPKVRNIRSRFAARVPVGSDGKYIHSAKPTVFYELLEALAAGPYVELFARSRRKGWTQYGNELA